MLEGVDIGVMGGIEGMERGIVEWVKKAIKQAKGRAPIIRPIVGSYGHIESWQAETAECIAEAIAGDGGTLVPESVPSISGALGGGFPSLTQRTRWS